MAANNHSQRAPSSTWHLAGTPNEQALSRVEIGMERLMHAYYRWKVSCMATVGDFGLTGDDITILNIIRKDDEAKKLSEVARILNRADTANMQYATRKLMKAELIEKQNQSSRKDTAYRITARGIDITDAYAAVRRELVAGRLDDSVEPAALMEFQAVLGGLITLYEQGATRASAVTAGFADVAE